MTRIRNELLSASTNTIFSIDDRTTRESYLRNHAFQVNSPKTQNREKPSGVTGVRPIHKTETILLNYNKWYRKEGS